MHKNAYFLLAACLFATGTLSAQKKEPAPPVIRKDTPAKTKQSPVVTKDPAAPSVVSVKTKPAPPVVTKEGSPQLPPVVRKDPPAPSVVPVKKPAPPVIKKDLPAKKIVPVNKGHVPPPPPPVEPSKKG